MAPRCCASASLLFALSFLRCSEGFSDGYDVCDRPWPAHGINTNVLPPISLALFEPSTHASVAAWSPPSFSSPTSTTSPAATSTYVLKLWGSTSFAGFIVGASVGAESSVTIGISNTSGAGSLSPADAQSRPMRHCGDGGGGGGGLTHITATSKTRVVFSWTPPPAGTGTVTFWAVVVTCYRGSNFHLKLEIPETSSTPSPSPLPSPSSSSSSSPSPGALVRSAGTVVLEEDVRLWWQVREAEQLVDFSLSAAGRVWLSLARASSFSMIAPSSGVAVVGLPPPPTSSSSSSPSSAAVAAYLMNGYSLRTFAAVSPSAENGIVSTSVAYDGQRTVFNFSRTFAALGLGASAGGGGTAGVEEQQVEVEGQRDASASGDGLSVDPRLPQGYVYAVGESEAFDGHVKQGFTTLQLLLLSPSAPNEASAPGSAACPTGQSCSSSFPHSSLLTPNLAIAWRVDAGEGVLHMQLAFAVPSRAERRWVGIAFNDGPEMVGGDAIAVEPGLPPGHQVNRYALKGKTSSRCPPATEDGTLLASFSSYAEVEGMLSRAEEGRTAPAARLLVSSSSPAASSSTAVTILSTFSRKLTPASAAAAAAGVVGGSGAGLPTGERAINPGAELTLIWAWGPAGALRMGSHTTETSGARVVTFGLEDGAVPPPAAARAQSHLLLLALHAVGAVVGTAVLIPFGAAVVLLRRGGGGTMTAQEGGKRVSVRLSRLLEGQQSSSSTDGPWAWWRRAHAQISWLGVLVAVAGAAAGIVLTDKVGEGEGDQSSQQPAVVHFSSFHGRVGGACVGALLLVALLSGQRCRPPPPRGSGGRSAAEGDGAPPAGVAAVSSQRAFGIVWRLFHLIVSAFAVLVCVPLASYTGLRAAGELAGFLVLVLVGLVGVPTLWYCYVARRSEAGGEGSPSVPPPVSPAHSGEARP